MVCVNKQQLIQKLCSNYCAPRIQLTGYTTCSTGAMRSPACKLALYGISSSCSTNAFPIGPLRVVVVHSPVCRPVLFAPEVALCCDKGLDVKILAVSECRCKCGAWPGKRAVKKVLKKAVRRAKLGVELPSVVPVIRKGASVDDGLQSRAPDGAVAHEEPVESRCLRPRLVQDLVAVNEHVARGGAKVGLVLPQRVEPVDVDDVQVLVPRVVTHRSEAPQPKRDVLARDARDHVGRRARVCKQPQHRAVERVVLGLAQRRTLAPRVSKLKRHQHLDPLEQHHVGVDPEPTVFVEQDVANDV
eukprot:3793171-Pleurochrysis_carterae.AAC.1